MTKPAPQAGGKKRTLRERIAREWKEHYALYILMILPMAVLILFKYVPMYGVQIAFRDYKPVRGVTGSAWVGLKYFNKFFSSSMFWPLIRNTLSINLYLLATFPLALILALTLPTTRALLKLMGTPEEQMGYAYDYIFIIFIGIPATILYNMGACVLRSLGDSKSPVWFLAIASVINIVLDLLTVCVLGMGVAGAAIATVVSQLGSGVLCVWYMRKHFEVLRMEKDDWRLRKAEALRLLGMGVPVGLQFSITAIGSVMLQSAVNSLGAVCVSGVAVASKIYMLLCCPIDALAMAATNFTGQNLGAGKYDRIRQGTYACLLLGIIYCAIYIVIARFGTQYLVLLFMNADEAQSVLDYTQRMSYAYAYGTPLLLGVNVFRLSIQGMGYSRLSLISGLLEMIARTAVGIWGVPQFGFAAACLASPLAWALADCFLIPAYYGCLNARRRQAARVRRELPSE